MSTGTDARHWSFTINNPTDLDAEQLSALDCVYMVYQKEQGENETPHYQGAFGFSRTKKLTWLSRQLPRAHLTVTRNVPAAIEYCRKEEGRIDGPWVRGTLPERTQGKRSDLLEIQAKVLAGTSMRTLAEEHFNSVVRYGRNLQAVVTAFQPPRDFATKIYVFWGPTGTGKTFAAMKFPKVYKTPAIAKNGMLWFDGYDPIDHETVLVDDFYGGIKWTELLNLTDRYPHLVQSKGGMIQFRPKQIIFTSNTRPESWYPKMDFAPFKRRLLTGGLFYFPKDGEILLEMDHDGSPIGSEFPRELMHAPSPDVSHHESDSE